MTAVEVAAARQLRSITVGVGMAFGVKPFRLTGPERAGSVTRARFAAVWVARSALATSWCAIGRALGDRDHSTIMHAFRRAEALRAADAEFLAKTDCLLATVRERLA